MPRTTSRTSRTRPRAAPLAVVATAASAALVAGIAFLGGAVVARDAASAAESTAVPKLLGDVAPAPPQGSAAVPVRTCSITDQATAPGALELHGEVVDTATGEVRYALRADEGNPTASVMKLLTTTAALSVLGPDHRIPTRIYAGAEPGTVVVVGGGDVTLSSLPAGAHGYYAGATASVADLVAQARSALGGDAVTRVVVDGSLFQGPAWQPSWHDVDRTDGYVAPATALMIDGDRAVPQNQDSPRSLDPLGRAGAAFASAFGLPASAVSTGTAPADARLLAEAYSQPVSELVAYALEDSDNQVAETLARLVAIQQGYGNTFDAVEPSTTHALAALGLDTTGLRLADGSGLSGDSRVPPAFVVSLLQRVDDGDFPAIGANLPASAQTGTLRTRFAPDGSGVPAGAIRAKTGFIDDVYGLAGYLTGPDGEQLTFAFFVVGRVAPANRDSLDSLTAAAYGCGARLAGW